jgi:hypothetical protein
MPAMAFVSQAFDEALLRQSFVSPNSLSLVPASRWTSSTQSFEFAAAAFKSTMIFLSEELQVIVYLMDIASKQLHEHKAQLRSIHKSLIQEESMIIQEQRSLLTKFWTIVGGNQRKLHTLQERLALSRNLGRYHIRMLAHVGDTLRKLRTMHSDIVDLKDRANSAFLHIPPQIHMQGLTISMERLQRQIKAGGIGNLGSVRRPGEGDGDGLRTVRAEIDA